MAPPEDHLDAAADAPGGDDEEVPGRDYFFDEDQDGRIMEVDEEGNLRSPLPSPTPVFSAHFVLTRAHPGRTSRSVTHPQISPGQARLTSEFFGDGLPEKSYNLLV